jgi:hypothetical protein
MIDSLAVIIQYLKSADLSTRQIAEKHRYVEVWEAGSSSILVRWDGGEVDLYAPIQKPRLEVRCYAKSASLAGALLGEVIELSRTTHRESVTIGSETALLYELLQESGPSMQYDDDVKMDFALMFFTASVAESNIG